MALFNKQRKTFDTDAAIEEAPEYLSRTEFNKPGLVMEAVADCRKKRAVEMKKGFFNEKLDRYGNVAKEWKEDTRKVFIASINALRHLLAPEIESSKGKAYLKFEAQFKKDLQILHDKFAYAELVFVRDKLGNQVAKPTGVKYLPDIGCPVNVRTNKGWETLHGAWDGRIHAYTDEALDLYDDMFAELNKLINSIGYFKEETRYG